MQGGSSMLSDLMAHQDSSDKFTASLDIVHIWAHALGTAPSP